MYLQKTAEQSKETAHHDSQQGSNMSDDEIDKAVKEAAAFEAQDKKRKEGIDTKNEADALVFQTKLSRKLEINWMLTIKLV